MGTGRVTVIGRMARMIVLCQTRKTLPSIGEMAREFGVCNRTIMRDLKALSEAGVAVPMLRTEKREVA